MFLIYTKRIFPILPRVHVFFLGMCSRLKRLKKTTPHIHFCKKENHQKTHCEKFYNTNINGHLIKRTINLTKSKPFKAVHSGVCATKMLDFNSGVGHLFINEFIYLFFNLRAKRNQHISATFKRTHTQCRVQHINGFTSVAYL